MKKQHLAVSLMIVLSIMLVGMALYIAMKQAIFPNVTAWKFHIITVFFSSVLAAAGAYFVMKRRELSLREEMDHRRQAEDDLLKSKEKYRLVVENAWEAILIAQDGALTFVNSRASTMIGYPEDILTSRPFIDFVYPDDRGSVIENYSRRIRGEGAPSVYTFRIVCQNGDVRWVEINSVAVPWEGKPATLNFLRDITERKEAEQALRESEERYSRFSEAAFEGVLVTKKEIVIDASRQFAHMLAYEQWEVIGINAYDLISPDCRDSLRRHIVSGSEHHVETCAVRKDGSILPIEIRTKANEKGGIIVRTTAIRDISKRKKAEEELKKSEEKFRTLFESANDAIILLDRGHIVDCNRKTLEMFGCISKDQFLGKTLEDFSPTFQPDGRDSSQKGVEQFQAALTGTSQIFEWRYLRCNGSPFDGEVSLHTMELDDKKMVQAIVRNISERKRAEVTQRESDQRLSDIINFLPDATLVIDKNGIIIAWNKAMELMTGVKAKDMVGRGNHEYAIPFYGKRRPMLIDLVLKPEEDKEGSEIQYRHLSRQGSVLIAEAHEDLIKRKEIYHLLATAAPLYNTKGAIVGAIETIRDISEHRVAETELKESEERLRIILETTSAGIIMMEADGTVLFANRRIAEMFGYDYDSFIGTNYFDHIPHPEKSASIVRFKELKGIPHGQMASECRYLRRDGSELWGYVSARPMPVKKGAPQIVVFVTDMTGLKQAEHEKRMLEDHLRQAQKMEAIGTLAGGIAHDFNNILSAIMGYTEISQREAHDRPKVLHSLDQVLKATNRARDLVKQILTFSRKSEFQKRPTPLVPIIKEVVKFIRASLPSDIEVRYSIDASTDLIMADSTQMHQVLMNLCTNAGHAMRQKKGLLEIGLSEITIDEEDLVRHPFLLIGRHLDLSVRDTGYGIVPGDLERIFEPYFTTGEKGDGAGLGLSVVDGIVKEHGGYVTVLSEAGKGTIFHIYLPLAKQQYESGRSREDMTMPRGNANILYIDGDRMLANLNKLLLEDLGYRVIAETDPAIAIEEFREEKDAFDLVITEKALTGMTGYDVALELRKIRLDIPIILCMGSEEDEDRERQSASGITHFLAKPIRMRDMAEAINILLSKDGSQGCEH